MDKVTYSKDGNSAVAVFKAQSAVAEHVVNEKTQAVAPVSFTALQAQHGLGSQTLTLLGNGALIDLCSQRTVGLQHRRSITIHPENLDQLIKGLQAIQRSQRAGKLVATVTIRDGVILK